jgi:Mn-dependent DtxR family transcriptional regulator
MPNEVEKSVLAFEEKHLVAIMMFLSINGSCRKIDVYQNVSSNPRIPDKLDRLEALGLITQKPSANSRSVQIELTKRGRAIADRLIELDQLIKAE